jgi:gluconolactonase
MIICTPDNVQSVCDGLDHPECLAFAADGAIIAGGEAGQIYRIDAETLKPNVIANTGGFVLGVATDAGGAVYACDCRRNEVLKIGYAGGVSVYSVGTPEYPAINPNYGAFDRHGNYFYTASGEYFHPNGNGRLFCVTPEGKTECVHPGPFRFANGICLDAERDRLYLVQSPAASILVFRLDGPRLRSLQPEQEYVLEKSTVPDGVALDADRNLYVGYYVPDQIAIVRSDGRFEILYRDFTAELLNRPTNVALRRDEIYFSNLGGWNIGRIEHRLEPLEPVMPEF